MFTPKLHAEKPPARVPIKHICSVSVWVRAECVLARKNQSQPSPSHWYQPLLLSQRETNVSLTLSLLYMCLPVKYIKSCAWSAWKRAKETSWYLILSLADSLCSPTAMMLAEARANTRALLTQLLLPRLSPLSPAAMQIMNGKKLFPARGACRFLSGRSDDAAPMGGWNLYANFCRCSNKQARTHTPAHHTQCVPRRAERLAQRRSHRWQKQEKYNCGDFFFSFVKWNFYGKTGNTEFAPVIQWIESSK